MIRVSHDSPGKLAVRFQYNPAVVTMMHTIPGRGWDRDRRCWVIPESVAPVLLAKCNGQYEVKLDEYVESLLSRQHDLERSSRTLAPGVPVQPPPGLSFIGFQEVGIHWVDQVGGRALIADEVGLGKSIEFLGYARKHPELRPVVLCCPATMKGTWEREANKWLADLPDKVLVLSGTKPYDTGDATFMILNYDILYSRWKKPTEEDLIQIATDHCTWDGVVKRGCCTDRLGITSSLHAKDCPARDILASAIKPPPGWSDKLAPKLLGLDECQALKNGRSKRAKEAKKLARVAKAVVGLTGTPILNRPIEIYSQIEIINPRIFPSWYGFALRYCAGGRQTIRVGKSHPRADDDGYMTVFKSKGASNLDEMDTILRRNVMIRRLKRDVMKQLPAVRKATLWVEAAKTKTYLQCEAKLKAKARQYKAMAEELRNRMKGKQPAQKKRILAQSAADASAFTLKGQMIQEITRMRQEIGKMKYPAILDWAQQFLTDNPEHKLLVFAWHIAVQEKLVEDLEPFGRVAIGGGMSHKRRDEAVQRFQNDPKVRVIVLSENAAREGITLTAASNELIAELPWRPGDMEQFAGRVSRIGQKNPCTQWITVVGDTIEEKIAQLIDAKRTVVAAAMGDVDAYEQDVGILEALIDELASDK